MLDTFRVSSSVAAAKRQPYVIPLFNSSVKGADLVWPYAEAYGPRLGLCNVRRRKARTAPLRQSLARSRHPRTFPFCHWGPLRCCPANSRCGSLSKVILFSQFWPWTTGETAQPELWPPAQYGIGLSNSLPSSSCAQSQKSCPSFLFKPRLLKLD